MPGVGNGTKRIKHGQTCITTEGDAGIALIHDDEREFVPSGAGSDVATNNPHIGGREAGS